METVEVIEKGGWKLYVRSPAGYSQLKAGTGPQTVQVEHTLGEDENFIVIADD